MLSHWGRGLESFQLPGIHIPCKGRLSLQREVIGRLGKEGEGERTRGDTLGRTLCLEHQDREVERISVHAEAVCTAWISF
jgi:hypothetical protein